jgi:demethylmenaquinone methyltransferase/2-methoxy-6-polyprenyl-1,4-benzoquinol methylase
LADVDSSGLEGLRGTFGVERVGDAARRLLVRELFDRVAPRYDLMNDLMSLGLHRLWKLKTVALAVAAAAAPGPVIDLAGGTGDLAALLRARLADRLVVNMDASPGMVAQAAERGIDGLGLAVAEAERLPLADQSAALVTLSFGLRNMTDPQGALREVHRVLRPGGALALLEFSRPYAWFAPFYGLYSRFVIPALGALVARDVRAYRYLVESIRLFPGADSISRELESAGFRVARVKRFMLGIAALHVAVKP